MRITIIYTGEVEMQVSEVHSEIISSVSFDIGGKYILTAGDKYDYYC